METKTYFFQPEKKVLKQGYFLEDENKNIVYEAKMLKQPLIGAMEFEFINRISGSSELHKVGHTVTMEEESTLGFFSKKSSFKYDGKNIWDYLHEKGVRIDTAFSGNRLGMNYTVSLEGKEIATIANAAPGNAQIFVTTRFWLNVTTTEEHLDTAFLVALAIARTEQDFYN